MRSNLVAIGKRYGLNDGDAIDGDQPVGAGNAPAAVEGVPDHGEKGEEKQRHGKGTEREEQADLLAEKVGQDERAEFHAPPPAAAFWRDFRRLHQDAFLQMQHHVRAGGNQRVVRDHQDGLVVFAHQFLNERHDFIGALAVKVAGGLVAEEKGGIGDDGAGDGDTLLLSAGELAGKMTRRGRGSPTMESAASTCSRRADRERLREEQRKLNILVRREHRNEVVHLKDKPDVAGAPFGELAATTCG